MSIHVRERELEIYGPSGIRAFVEAVRQTVQFALTFPIEIFEVEGAGLVCEEREYTVGAVWADHAIPSLAYAFVEKPRPGRFHPEKALSLGIPEGSLWSKLQRGLAIKLPNGQTVHPEEVLGPPRPGRKIVYTGDTRASKDVIKLAEGADLMIHEATFDDEMLERAQEDGHSTPSQAAEAAKEASVKRLILTHISARYRTPKPLLEQARKIFPQVEAAEDFMKIDLPLAETKE